MERNNLNKAKQSFLVYHEPFLTWILMKLPFYLDSTSATFSIQNLTMNDDDKRIECTGVNSFLTLLSWRFLSVQCRYKIDLSSTLIKVYSS